MHLGSQEAPDWQNSMILIPPAPRAQAISWLHIWCHSTAPPEEAEK